MPESLNSANGSQKSAVQADLRTLFPTENQYSKAAVLLGSTDDQIPESTAERLSELLRAAIDHGVHPSGLSSLLFHLSPLLQQAGIASVASEILAFLRHQSHTFSAARAIDILVKQCTISSLSQLHAATQLASCGLYPTPKILDHLCSLREPKRQEACLQSLYASMQRIREQEEFDDDDPLALELYYTYLNVNIPFHEFEQALKEVPSRSIGRVPSHFRPFRISARGVEALTHDTDPAFVASSRERFLNHSTPLAAQEVIQRAPGLPASALPPAFKDEFLRNASLTIAETMAKEGKVNTLAANPFTPSNILGSLEPVLDAPPSPQTFVLLHYARRALGEFLIATNAYLKKEKLIRDEQRILLQNAARAENLLTRCNQILARDAHHVGGMLEGEGFREIDTFLELIMDLELQKQRTNDEERLFSVTSQAAFEACFRQISALPSATLQEILKDLAFALQRSCVAGRSDAPQRLWECLAVLTLQRSPEAEIQHAPANVVLERERELIQEQIPEQLQDVARSEERNTILQKDVHGALRSMTEHEAKETVRCIRNALAGAETFFEKRGQSPTLREGFASFRRSLEKKLKEIERRYDAPPTYINRYYAPENTTFLMRSCRYHVADGRTFSQMLASEGISEPERAFISSFREKIRGYADHLEIVQRMMTITEAAWGTPFDAEQGLQGLAGRISAIHDLMQADVDGHFPPYTAYHAEREWVESEYLAEKERVKEQLHREYETELQQSGEEFDPGEFFPRVHAAIRTLDQQYSQKLRAMRRSFEQQNQDIVRALQLYERLLDGTDKIRSSLSPLRPIQERLGSEVLTQLSKIQYRELGEGEFELVPSKTKGDAIKGWVSNDCSAAPRYARQIRNGNFVNYRVYQRHNGDRLWIGNVYVLDAQWGDEPEILFDAIQVSRSTSVQPRMFVQGVVDGFAKIGVLHDYGHIISNVITTTAEGYLVSNRPQLREAYIRLFQGNPVIASDDDEATVDIRDETAKDTFQSLNRGDGTFKVLWQHPDVQPIASREQIEELIRGAVDAKVADKLMACAEGGAMPFQRLFQSRRGYESLQALRGQPERLSLYLTLLAEHFGSRAALGVIRDPHRFALVEEFAQICPDVASPVVSTLTDAGEQSTQFLRQTPVFLRSRPDLVEFAATLLRHHIVLPPASLEHCRAVYTDFERSGLGEDALRQVAMRGEDAIPFLQPFAAIIRESEFGRDDVSLMRTLLQNPSVFHGMDVRSVWTSMRRFQSIASSVQTTGRSGLSANAILYALGNRTIRNPEELAFFVGALDAAEAERKAFHLHYAGQGLAMGGLPISAMDRFLAVLWRCSELGKPSGQGGASAVVLSADELFQRMLKAPADLPQFEELFANMATRGRSQERFVCCSSLIRDKSSITAALRLSTISDQDLDDAYFYLFQLGDAALAEPEGTLEQKFMERAFAARGLTSVPGIQHLVRSGVGYLFAREEYAEPLARYFAPRNLQTVPKSQQGESERIRENNLEEEIPVGYGRMDEFIADQVSIYSLPFHQ